MNLLIWGVTLLCILKAVVRNLDVWIVKPLYNPKS
jgi:hypothetical protein